MAGSFMNNLLAYVYLTLQAGAGSDGPKIAISESGSPTGHAPLYGIWADDMRAHIAEEKVMSVSWVNAAWDNSMRHFGQ